VENEFLKILLVSADAEVSRRVEAMLSPTMEVTAEPTVDAGLAMLATNNFHAVLLALSAVNAAALFQITLLTTRAAQLPVLVLGPESDENFIYETVYSGAQDFMPLAKISESGLRRSLMLAIARHQERLALVEEKNNYFSVLDHLVEGVFRTTVDGHYMLANVALAKIYGYDSAVELMANIKDIGLSLYVDAGRRAEFVRLMQESDTLTGFESRIRRKDGGIIWIAENCRAVRDAQGKLLYYEGTVADITQHRQMEEAIKLSESLYHSLVETMPQGVFRRDLNGRFTFANQTYCDFFGMMPDSIIGKTDFDQFPRELAEKYWGDDQAIMQKGETTVIIEETQPIGASEKQYHHVTKTPLRDDEGNIIGLQGMVWDITEKVRIEERVRRTTAELARSREDLRQKNAVMEENLRTAREIQLAMLPQQYPVFPPNTPVEQSALKFLHRYQPAETVSGDFFTVSQISANEAGILICDVTGHGTRAALVTAMIRAIAEELKPLARDPANFLRKLNFDLHSILKTTGSPMLTTAFYCVADCATGTLRFANAGHPKPLLVSRSAKTVKPLANASGRGQPALGLFEDPVYETTEHPIQPGDFLMLFTDGIYEVQGQHEEMYSQERLMHDVKNLIAQPSSEMFDQLIEVVRGFALNNEFEDDVCLVGMDFVRKV
jgi:sigma-B regulation protein RsbU (phosphoserine phosphatase)